MERGWGSCGLWFAMFSLIAGEPVVVVRPSVTLDELGEPIYGEPVRTMIPDVLVTPGATSDMDASRPNGVTVSFTLGFPKSFHEPLRGCSVEVRGDEYAVVGNPHPLTPQNIPGPYNYTVEVTSSDG